MTDKILKRLVDIAKHRRDVEIDTIAQISIYTGNESDYYRIYDRDLGVIYIIEESEMVFDLSRFNVCEKLVLSDLGTGFADDTMDLEYCKSEDGKKILENVYSTFDYIMGIPSEKLELFKFKKLAYNKNTKCVTLFEKDWEVVGFIKPNWVEERGDK